MTLSATNNSGKTSTKTVTADLDVVGASKSWYEILNFKFKDIKTAVIIIMMAVFFIFMVNK